MIGSIVKVGSREQLYKVLGFSGNDLRLLQLAGPSKGSVYCLNEESGLEQEPREP